MNERQTAEWLMERDDFLILTHVRPDGDTIGCAAGLCLALRGRGKTAWVLENPEATSLFTPYLEGLTAPEGWSPDTVVSVDIAARGLFPENARCYLERVDLAIDHHPSQEFFARETCLDAGRAACGELIYDIAGLLGPVTREMAVPLYVAVSTDTRLLRLRKHHGGHPPDGGRPDGDRHPCGGAEQAPLPDQDPEAPPDREPDRGGHGAV